MGGGMKIRTDNESLMGCPEYLVKFLKTIQKKSVNKNVAFPKKDKVDVQW